MTPYDHAILALYFVFMLAVSWVVRRLIRNSGDYFRSGGEAQWWMTGGTVFMVAFTAWTFTGAASRAYSDGWPIAVIYLANAVALVFGALSFGPRLRQLRVVTPVDAIRLRFGPGSEQFFTWLTVVTGLIVSSVGLYGLGIFFSAAFGADLGTTILVTGATVLFIALLSGSWAVMAGDFVQVLVLMPVAVIVLLLAFSQAGGPEAAFEQLTTTTLDPGKFSSQAFLPFWCVAMLVRSIVSINNFDSSSRFLCVRNTQHARWAGFLAAALMLAGVVLWFLPPMMASLSHRDLAAVFPNLRNPAEGAYFAIVRDVLPIGALGLFVSGIFAATMSSMDSGLNKAAGILVLNFYVPLLRPQARDQERLVAGKAATLVFGALVIALAVFLIRFRELSLFQIMMDVTVLLLLPLVVPQFLCIYLRRTPSWSGWSTVLVAFFAGLTARTWLNADWATQVFGYDRALDPFEIQNWDQASGSCAVLGAGTAWFTFTALFYRRAPQAYQEHVAEFCRRLDTPVADGDTDSAADSGKHQSQLLGWLCIPYGVVLCLCALFFPNPLPGKVAFFCCGLTIVAVGTGLLHSAGRLTKK
jgi:SSS family solute:Na+ symporter